LKLAILALTLIFASLPAAFAQAVPTATQKSAISVFGGATGTFTGLGSGKNLGITAGLDVRFPAFFGIDPSIEVRGTYPIHDGDIDSQENVVGGLKLEKILLHRIHPYIDVLFGRGQIDYQGDGYPSLNGQYFYLQTPSNVFSPGAGVDLDLTPHLALKADAQFQRYTTPVTVSGTLYAKPLTVGVVYRFDFNGHRRR
jgi:opacity protein-like surface antigen